MEESGGYDYDVADDGVYDEFYCPICTKLKRNAVEMECEHSLCSSCLDEWKKKAQELLLEFNCPECRKPILNAKVQRSGAINRIIKTSIRVKCKNMPEGCQWIGVILDMEEHLQKKCDYFFIPCLNEHCPEHVQRIDLNTHLLKCWYRTTPCQYCGVVMLLIDIQGHLLICNLLPVQCKNKGCKDTMSRESMAFHHLNECTFRTIDCQYAGVGCTVKILRCEVDDHENSFMARHMSLMFQNTVSLQEELKETKQSLKETQQSLKETRQSLANTDFKANFILKSIRGKLESDLEELEKLVDEFSLRAGSFTKKIFPHLGSSVPDPEKYKSVLSMYLDLHYKACNLTCSYDIKRFKGVEDVFLELASSYDLTTNHIFLYKSYIEAGCKDLIQKFEKLCGIHKTVEVNIREALNSFDVLRDCVEKSLKVRQRAYYDKYLLVEVKVKDLCDSNEWKLSIQRSNRHTVKVLSEEKIIEMYLKFFTVNEAIVLKPLWNVAVKLKPEKKNDNSLFCSFPVKDLVADGCANYLESLFIVLKEK